MTSWVVVITKPAAEEIAERDLRRAGYRVYLPRYRKLLSPHGRDRRPVTSMRPLFTGYLFAEDWRGWPRETVHGVEGLLHRSGSSRHALFSGADIQAIRDRESSFDEMRYAAGQGRAMIREDVSVGDVMTVDIGSIPMQAVLRELSADGRALVEVMIFGRVTPMRVEQEALLAAGG
ncbi:MAG TPA: transcription termination/antitermination NusG family protein [Bradyrhizobium sp.]|nr:transcription termination/antitermination NusG family protein [Bradyrhizobium sp.]